MIEAGETWTPLQNGPTVSGIYLMEKETTVLKIVVGSIGPTLFLKSISAKSGATELGNERTLATASAVTCKHTRALFFVSSADLEDKNRLVQDERPWPCHALLPHQGMYRKGEGKGCLQKGQGGCERICTIYHVNTLTNTLYNFV